MVHPIFTALSDKTLYYLPSRLQNLTVHEALITSPFPRSIYAHIVFRQWTPRELCLFSTVLRVTYSRNRIYDV
jgi:hypothetical protein